MTRTSDKSYTVTGYKKKLQYEIFAFKTALQNILNGSKFWRWRSLDK